MSALEDDITRRVKKYLKKAEQDRRVLQADAPSKKFTKQQRKARKATGVSDPETDTILAAIGVIATVDLPERHPETGRYVAAKGICLDKKVPFAAKRTAVTVAMGLLKTALGGSTNAGDLTPEQIQPTGSLGTGGVLRTDLGKLEKALAEATDPVEKDRLGQEITYARLVKNANDEQLAKTAAMIQSYMDSATHTSATLTPTGADSEGQTRAIGSGSGQPQSLGSPTGANRGDLTGAQGRTEAGCASTDSETRRRASEAPGQHHEGPPR